MKSKLFPFLITLLISITAYSQEVNEIPESEIPSEMISKVQQDFPTAKSETNWSFDNTEKVYLAKFSYRKRPTVVKFDEKYTWISTRINAPQYFSELPKAIDNAITKYFKNRHNLLRICKISTFDKGAYYQVEAIEGKSTDKFKVYAINFSENGEILKKYYTKEEFEINEKN